MILHPCICQYASANISAYAVSTYLYARSFYFPYLKKQMHTIMNIKEAEAEKSPSLRIIHLKEDRTEKVNTPLRVR